jgi:glutamine amidotransferase
MGFAENPVHVAATANYGLDVTALVWDGKFTFGAQFHPEKSGDTGLAILKNFLSLGIGNLR